MSQSNTSKSSKQTSLRQRYREVVNDNGYELMGSYVAGIMDATASVTVVVGSQPNARLGYRIVPRIQLQRHQPDLVGVVDEFAMEHGIRGKVKERETSTGTKYVYTIESRDDVEKFLELVEPFLLVKHDPVQIILNEVMPRLREGRHSTKEGFIETMEYVDMVRETTGATSQKYSKEYFEKEWADDL